MNLRKLELNFIQGLNTVLGTIGGDNSIGKSTFLLIIDFVFGGTTYAESYDIIKNVGEHEICFSFLFEKQYFYFTRNIVKYREVWKCDEKYQKIGAFSLADYCNWLDSKYDLQIPYLTFRNIVGRYIRVYGKDNANEKLPLHNVSNEKMHDACYALLKLFNLYMPVHKLAEQAENSEEELKAYRKAQKYNFISDIGKRQYLNNIKLIQELDGEITKLSENVENGLTTLDAEISEEAVSLKKVLSNARRMRSNIKIRLDSITEDFEYKFTTSTNDFDELKKYFPGVNLKKLQEVEAFHHDISRIFKSELQVQKRQLVSDLKDLNEIISENEKQLHELIGDTKISKTVLKRHAELVKTMEQLRIQNAQHDGLSKLKEAKMMDENRLEEIERTQFAILQDSVNKAMREINEYIYEGRCNAL